MNEAENSRPRRTERAHRGKPDFYSPSDYENPFRKHRKRTSSAELDMSTMPKRKGRPPKLNLSRTARFDSPSENEKLEEDSLSIREDGESLDKHEDMTEDTKSDSSKNFSPVRNDEDSKEDSLPVKPNRAHLTFSHSQFSKLVKTPSCDSLASSKDQKDGTSKGKESKDKEKVDVYSTLTSEKVLQCAIILSEINRKFCSQNFKP